MLYEDVNKMLIRKFITPSKLFLGTSVLFTNKKDKSLHFCVDYHGLNARIKKNKYLLPLVRILLDCFAGAKYYTKFDIIAIYNALCI